MKNRRCQKSGHKKKERVFRIYRNPAYSPLSSFRVVAELCDRKEVYCGRCGKVFDQSDEVVDSYTGIKWPSEMYEHFQKHGWVKA